VPEEIGEAEADAVDGMVHLPALLADGFGVSRSDARRQLAGGGVKLGGEVVTEMDVPAERIDGKVVQLGKRRFARVRVK
jgi:tyrosyl-tRNA synthetase